MKMNEFKTYHPIVNFTYFVIIIAFSCIYTHPVCIGASVIFGAAYSVMLGGMRRLKFNLCCLLPLMLAAALINPAFNHRGMTILSYLPGGNPLTFESIIYGIAAAGILGSVILHFYCYTKIMTSDKFIYLFGKIIPSLSLILSMTLSFIPRFKLQLARLRAGQKCIGNDISGGGVMQRIKCGAEIFSAMLTWSLRSSIDTADSMKSRGYGLPRRTAFSIYRFSGRDAAALCAILISGIYIIIGGMTNAINYRYFPSFKINSLSAYGISVLIVYSALCAAPIIIEIKEAVKWRSLKRKI